MSLFVHFLFPNQQQGEIWGRDGEINPHRKGFTFKGLKLKIPTWGKFERLPISPSLAFMDKSAIVSHKL
jgi:hypothetical protein